VHTRLECYRMRATWPELPNRVRVTLNTPVDTLPVPYPPNPSHPLPVPMGNPYLWPRVRVLVGTGMGSLGVTWGLPVVIPNYLIPLHKTPRVTPTPGGGRGFWGVGVRVDLFLPWGYPCHSLNLCEMMSVDLPGLQHRRSLVLLLTSLHISSRHQYKGASPKQRDPPKQSFCL
jgi:hypothetical protein